MPLKVNLAHHRLPRIRRATSCAGAGLLLEHEGLVDVAQAHALGDVVPEALVGGGGGRGHGGILAPAGMCWRGV